MMNLFVAVIDYLFPLLENNVEISVADPNSHEMEANMLERKATSSPSKIPMYNRPGLLAGLLVYVLLFNHI